MELQIDDADQYLEESIQQNFTKLRNKAEKFIDNSVEEVKNTMKVIKSLNAGVDGTSMDDGVANITKFMKSMERELDGFPNNTKKINHVLLESIITFWNDFNSSFHKYGKRYYGNDYEMQLRVLKPILNRIQKQKEKLQKFLDKKYEKVSEVEDIKLSIQSLRDQIKTLQERKEELPPIIKESAEIQQELKKCRDQLSNLEDKSLDSKKDEIIEKKEDVEHEINLLFGKVKTNIPKMLKLVEHGRFYLRKTSYEEVEDYFQNLGENLVKDGIEFPKLSIIIDNLIGYVQNESMKENKKEKILSSIKAVKQGDELPTLISKLVKFEDKKADITEKMEEMDLKTKVRNKKRDIEQIGTQLSSLKDDEENKKARIAKIEDKIESLKLDIENELGSLSGEEIVLIF